MTPTVDNPLILVYIRYSVILILKMMLITDFIGYQRITKRIWLNPEDVAFLGGKMAINEKIERTRRSHLNDLENIPIFLAASFCYVLTNPDLQTAIMLFRVFTIARILHSLVYGVTVVAQPARSLCFIAGHFVTLYMVMKVLIFTSGCC